MNELITILGPTASGKTKLAAHLAAGIHGEVISADSRQVYRGMDIGTGKDLADFQVAKEMIPYHLIDIVEPGYEYNVYEFQCDFLNAFRQIHTKGKVPIMCGGTGLYIDAVINSYQLDEVAPDKELRSALEKLSDKELIHKLTQYGDLHNTTDTTDRQRTIRALEILEHQKDRHGERVIFPKINSINFGIYFAREITRQRITERLSARLKEGMIREVNDLLENGMSPEQLTFYGLEYRFVTEFVIGSISYDEMFQKLNTAIHQFAKRQMTWFRRMERRGSKIIWIEGSLPLEQKISFIKGCI